MQDGALHLRCCSSPRPASWLWQLVPYLGSQKKRGVMSSGCYVKWVLYFRIIIFWGSIVFSTLWKHFMQLIWTHVTEKFESNIKRISEAVVPRCSIKWEFLKISRNVIEKQLCRSLFSIMLQGCTDSRTVVFLWILRDFQELLFYRTPTDDCFWSQPKVGKFFFWGKVWSTHSLHKSEEVYSSYFLKWTYWFSYKLQFICSR